MGFFCCYFITAHSWYMIEFEIMRTRKFCLFTYQSSNIHLRICIMTHSDAVEAPPAFSFLKKFMRLFTEILHPWRKKQINIFVWLAGSDSVPVFSEQR